VTFCFSYPKAKLMITGRSSGLSRSWIPSRFSTVVYYSKHRFESNRTGNYSCGDSSCFQQDSLLFLTEPKSLCKFNEK